MKKNFPTIHIGLAIILLVFFFGCTKYFPWPPEGHHDNDAFNLDVPLNGVGDDVGFLQFRQDPDTARIITLETWLKNLKPNTSYQLQRAVDQTLDGNCTGTAWLTLGKGLTPQSIITDKYGNGHEELFRDITALARGTQFDIHFQIIEESTGTIVLTSDCYQYTVR